LRKGLSIYSFDQNISWDLLSAAKSWGNQNEILLIPSPEIKGHFHYIWDPNDLKEAEILLEGSKIKDFRCTCEAFHLDQICRHIIAMLLNIQHQKNLQQRSRADQQNKSYPKASYKNSLDEWLHPVDKEELVQFIKEYATSNRDFYLNLKTRFIQYLNPEDSSQKLTDLLQAIIKHIRASGHTWTERKAEKLLKFTEQLTSQLTLILTKGDLKSTSNTLKILVEKILPICYTNEGFDAFKKLATEIITLLKKTYKSPKAPELNLQLEAIIQQIGMASWYIPWTESDNLYFCMKGTNNQAELRESLVEKLRITLGDRERQAVLMAGITFIFSDNDKTLPLPKDPWSLVQWNAFLSVIHYEKSIESCAANIKLVLEKLINDSIKPLAVQDLMNLLKGVKEQQLFVDNISNAILISGSHEYFPLLSAGIHEKLLEYMFDECKEIEDYRVWGRFALFTQQYSSLLERFETFSSIDATVGLSESLNTSDIAIHIEKIAEQMIEFLKSYYGEKNMYKLALLLEILEFKTCREELKFIKQALLKEIPDRRLLKATLSSSRHRI